MAVAKPTRDAAAKALVVHPFLKRRERGAQRLRAPEARLEEAVGLAKAIGLDIRLAELAPLATPRPATFVGSGKVDDLKTRIAEQEIAVAVVDGTLSPVQQRNLEKA
ncbi:MAG: GTPase HflX, partial [Alphaproteobacteria bacterium]|nr:GTPase HflX [Alphaproteobacteria bacterium]